MTKVLTIDPEVADRLGDEFDRIYGDRGVAMIFDKPLGREAYIVHFSEWEKPTIQVGAERAAELGHALESDPPGGITRARRLTCSTCGSAVLAYPGNEVPYGTAYTEMCS